VGQPFTSNRIPESWASARRWEQNRYSRRGGLPKTTRAWANWRGAAVQAGTPCRPAAFLAPRWGGGGPPPCPPPSPPRRLSCPGASLAGGRAYAAPLAQPRSLSALLDEWRVLQDLVRPGSLAWPKSVLQGKTPCSPIPIPLRVSWSAHFSRLLAPGLS